MNAPRRLFLLLALSALVACGDRHPTLPPINAAKPGTGGDPAVEAADPNNAPQDTTLDVRVLGTGFERGASAQWAIAGVPSPKITTNATRFVSSTELVANITIALDADTVLYDLIVTNPSGKKGIGTELFKVRAGGPPPPEIPLSLMLDDTRTGVVSDGAGAYVDGVDAVRAVLRSNGNLNFDSHNTTRRHLATRTATVTIVRPDVGVQTFADRVIQINTSSFPELGDVPLRDMWVGQEQEVIGGLHWDDGGLHYNLRLGRPCDGAFGVFVLANRFRARRDSETLWTLWTNVGQSGILCVTNAKNGVQVAVVQNVGIDFQFTIDVK